MLHLNPPKATIAAAVAAAVLAISCTTPEPVIQQVPVQVTVPVTRIVTQPVEIVQEATREVPVTVPVTRIVTQRVEILREVTREVPVTVIVTPTRANPATDSGASIAASAFTDVALKSMSLYFMNRGDRLEVLADSGFQWDRSNLNIFVDADLSVVVDAAETCRAPTLCVGCWEPETLCDLEFRSHTSVQQVSVQTPLATLECKRSQFSDDLQTIFICDEND